MSHEISLAELSCSKCVNETGIISYSNNCEHIFCKACFMDAKNKSDRCPYCNEKDTNSILTLLFL